MGRIGHGAERKFSHTNPNVRVRTIGAGLFAVMSAVGLFCGCAAHHRSAAGSASFQSADCPNPNYPGVPDANLGPNYSCGYLTVPENRRVPNGRTIRLLVARVKAATSAPRPDPI